MMIDKLMQGMKEIGWDLEILKYMDKQGFISLIGYHIWILTLLWQKDIESDNKILTCDEESSMGFILDLLGVLKEDNNAKA
jgi:hypothetical protein